jgi:hypothetical protein
LLSLKLAHTNELHCLKAREQPNLRWIKEIIKVNKTQRKIKKKQKDARASPANNVESCIFITRREEEEEKKDKGSDKERRRPHSHKNVFNLTHDIFHP